MKIRLKYIIIHFKPIELYPPALNFIEYLKTSDNNKFLVITTKAPDTLKSFVSDANNIHIKRYNSINPGSSFRIFSYLRFYVGTLLLLLKYHPATVLYFESISSWPGLIYKKFIATKTKLMVHYHEYSSPAEYQKNMRLVKQMHKLEKKMYGKYFDWISHTNEIRLADFKKDNLLMKPEKNIFHSIPNYPSKFWAKVSSKHNKTNNIKLVYLGALGFDNMYVKETLEWIKNNEQLSLDIYANIIDDKAASFLEDFKCPRVQYHGGVNYSDIPEMLQQYDVGLVMYKPFNKNTINAVSNKVFEYLACGLDVWFSKDMTFTLQYSREDTYPKIVPVDFNKLDAFDYISKYSKKDIPYHPTEYFYENVYPEIQHIMINEL